MNPSRPPAAEVVLPCAALQPTVDFFAELGFRVDAIFPADDPRVVQLSGHGLRLRLERDATDAAPGALRIESAQPERFGGGSRLVAPNGTRVDIVAPPTLDLPPLAPSFVVTHRRDDAWIAGRAGMQYRDLIPDRQGGLFIASHIRIVGGGPVPDQVHHHAVRFQVIYCARGWVDVLYQDQGERFHMVAGDCVLQPPGIRHRVLESSPGLEVVEVACPASHLTQIDHDLALPSPLAPGRSWAGQRFTMHQAERAAWRPWAPGLEARDTGIAEATDGLADVRVVRPVGDARSVARRRARGELEFGFVLRGVATLVADGHGRHELGAGDAFVIPSGVEHGLEGCSADLELLALALPASAAHVDR